MKALHITIYGIVQGVWFRATTREQAQRLGVIGWVRNTPDGAVEALMQGDDGPVDALLAWCSQGPPGARVEKITAVEVEPDEGIQGFRILY